jgi:pyruvate formate lyase activating enzyme
VQRTLDGKVFEEKLVVGRWQTAEEVMREIEKDAVFYSESGGGVTFSGGEPLMQAEALGSLLEKCSGRGYHTAIDTSGHAEPSAVKLVMGIAALWLYVLKLMDDVKHVEYTGVSNELALYNLALLARSGENIIIRFPLIPGITDEEENLAAVAGIMKKLGLTRIEVLPYHAIAREKYRRMGKAYLLDEMKEPGNERIEEIKKYFRDEQE